MNIIFFTRSFYPNIGGVETHVMEISKILIKKGHKITIITEHPESERKNNIEVQEIEGIQIYRIRTGVNDWYKKFRIWKELLKKYKLIKNADIIHAHDVFYWYFPYKLIFPFKKVYTTFHGYETVFPPTKKSIVVRKLSELLSKGNICIGEYIQKWYGTNPSFILYGGVSKIKNLHSSGSEQKKSNTNLKIILVGRLEKDIGIKTYLRSLEMLKKKKIKFEFAVYGEGKMKNLLKKYGKVNDFISDVSKEIESTDIVFASSYLIMIQALAIGKIVIAAYENPLKEDYLKLSPFASFIYICQKPNEIALVLDNYKNSLWKSKTMLDNGQVWAREQTWEKVSAIYLNLWNL